MSCGHLAWVQKNTPRSSSRTFPVWAASATLPSEAWAAHSGRFREKQVCVFQLPAGGDYLPQLDCRSSGVRQCDLRQFWWQHPDDLHRCCRLFSVRKTATAHGVGNKFLHIKLRIHLHFHAKRSELLFCLRWRIACEVLSTMHPPWATYWRASHVTTSSAAADGERLTAEWDAAACTAFPACNADRLSAGVAPLEFG